jgi:dethiobiotin synthetase
LGSFGEYPHYKHLIRDGNLNSMFGKPRRGLFITGTDTEVGKTYVAALIARALVQQGRRVGVYKPVASGCVRRAGQWISQDALALWEAAGRPLDLNAVCPQQFAAPLAPHLAARQEGRTVDADLLRSGLSVWTDHCDIVLVEGAGGCFSPLAENELVADLAADLGYPLVVVAANKLGVINHSLLTLNAADSRKLPVAGIVLNDVHPAERQDASAELNATELRNRCGPLFLGHVAFGQTEFSPARDWSAICRST